MTIVFISKILSCFHFNYFLLIISASLLSLFLVPLIGMFSFISLMNPQWLMKVSFRMFYCFHFHSFPDWWVFLAVFLKNSCIVEIELAGSPWINRLFFKPLFLHSLLSVGWLHIPFIWPLGLHQSALSFMIHLGFCSTGHMRTCRAISLQKIGVRVGHKLFLQSLSF